MYDLVYRLLEQNLHLARTRRLAVNCCTVLVYVFMTPSYHSHNFRDKFSMLLYARILWIYVYFVSLPYYFERYFLH